MSLLKLFWLLLIPLSLLIFLQRSLLTSKTCNYSPLCKKQLSKCFIPETCLCLNNSTKINALSSLPSLSLTLPFLSQLENNLCLDTCLGEHAEECSPCFSELFPKFCAISQHQEDLHHRQSVLEKFPETIPGLFQAITQNPDKFNRWEVVEVSDDGEKKTKKTNKENEKNEVSLRCIVVFLNECTSRVACRKKCLTMGARSYRWFHNGCCECVGEKCVRYGVAESMCKRCSPEMMEEENEE